MIGYTPSPLPTTEADEHAKLPVVLCHNTMKDNNNARLLLSLLGYYVHVVFHNIGKCGAQVLVVMIPVYIIYITTIL